MKSLERPKSERVKCRCPSCRAGQAIREVKERGTDRDKNALIDSLVLALAKTQFSKEDYDRKPAY